MVAESHESECPPVHPLSDRDDSWWRHMGLIPSIQRLDNPQILTSFVCLRYPFRQLRVHIHAKQEIHKMTIDNTVIPTYESWQDT